MQGRHLPPFLIKIYNMETTIRIAVHGIAEELRNMEVGEVVQFPIPDYNYNSIRTAPNSTLIKERLEGRRWKQKLDCDNRRVLVTRIA